MSRIDGAIRSISLPITLLLSPLGFEAPVRLQFRTYGLGSEIV